MAELKTKVNEASVEGFLSTIEEEGKRQDSFAMLELMKKAAQTEPKMWGTSIVGFGSYHYKYASGREGDMCRIGFSPRKQAITLYLMQDRTQLKDLYDRLGKYKAGVSCLYIKKLEDVDMDILEQLIWLAYGTT
jgi:hypothetical protein